VIARSNEIDERRTQLQRRALRLEYATIAWNVGETVFTIAEIPLSDVQTAQKGQTYVGELP